MATTSADQEIVELQTQLAVAVAARDQAIGDRNQAYLAGKAAERGNCSFLEKLPIEIRNEVYRLLLTACSAAAGTIWSASDHPENLPADSRRTSRVLYAANTFIIDLSCWNSVQSPVLRKWRTGDPDNMLGFATLRKVQKWRVILSADERDCRCPQSPSLVMFCRELYLQPPKSMEVLIQPMKKPSSLYSNWFNRSTYFKIEEIFQPLKLFRNVTCLGLRALKGMYYTDDTIEDDRIPHHIAPTLRSDLESLVQGSGQVILVFKMYERLADYACVFERCERFKNDMSVSYFRLVHGILYPPNDTDPRERTAEELLNPFTHHPVEELLQTANRQSIDREPNNFIRTRKDLLQYLEPQYQRIAAAAAKMADFVKSWKRPNNLLDPLLNISYWSWEGVAIEDFGIAVLHVEEYAKAFHRDAPLLIQGRIRAMQRQFDLAYRNLPRELLLTELSDWLEEAQATRKKVIKNSTNVSRFIKCFKAAVNDMDTQYLSIRKTRKALLSLIRPIARKITALVWKCGVVMR